jgi:hypothetical protein
MPTPTPTLAPVERPDDADEDDVLEGPEEVVAAVDGSLVVVVVAVEVARDGVVEELLAEEDVG